MTNVLNSTELVKITKEYLNLIPLDFRSLLNIAIIQIGNDAGSTKYIELKSKIGRELGIGISHIKFPEDAAELQIIEKITDLNSDTAVHGIMIQSPTPNHDLAKLSNAISPLKDVDGMSSSTLVFPAVVESFLKYLELIALDCSIEVYRVNQFSKSHFELRNEIISDFQKGKKICIVNDSLLIGQPLHKFFKSLQLDSTICNKFTQRLSETTKISDLIISATGVPGLITSDMIKENSILLDAGFPKADFSENVVGKASFLSPVPGGIGPLTVVSLFENLFRLLD